MAQSSSDMSFDTKLGDVKRDLQQINLRDNQEEDEHMTNDNDSVSSSDTVPLEESAYKEVLEQQRLRLEEDQIRVEQLPAKDQPGAAPARHTPLPLITQVRGMPVLYRPTVDAYNEWASVYDNDG